MKLTGLLIDPFQRKVHKVSVENDITAWHKLLDCDTLNVCHPFGDRAADDVWVDDDGLLREPRYPIFKLITYNNPLAGYGLVLASNSAGESVSTDLSVLQVTRLVQWEEWESRLRPEDYFEQLSRIYPEEGIYGLGSAEIHLCSICRTPYQGLGHNAQPVNEGRCCDQCNRQVVVPRRMDLMRKKK